MKIPGIEIVPFELSHQPGVDLLFNAIDDEFPERIFADPSQTLSNLSRSGNRTYWVALHDKKIIGTAGILLLDNNCCALKSMFLAKEFRGDKRETAKSLMQTAIDSAIAQGCTTIYLGTMEQFKGAQRFYEKHGFVQMPVKELPADFSPNIVDTVFYMKVL